MFKGLQNTCIVLSALVVKDFGGIHCFFSLLICELALFHLNNMNWFL